MDFDTTPLNARTGMVIAMTNTYMELVNLIHANDPAQVQILGRMLELAPIERDSLLSFIQERQVQLERRLREQLRTLLTYHQQELQLAKAKAEGSDGS